MNNMRFSDRYVFNMEDGYITIFDLEDECYYDVDQLGSLVISNIDQPIEKIVDIIVNIYEIDRETAIFDINEFIGNIEEMFSDE